MQVEGYIHPSIGGNKSYIIQAKEGALVKFSEHQRGSLLVEVHQRLELILVLLVCFELEASHLSS